MACGRIALRIPQPPEADVFALVVRFDLPDREAATAFDALVRDVLPGIRDEEPGTLLYATHTVEDEPLARVFYEVYSDRAAHAAHEARPGTAAFLERIGALVSAVRVEFLAPGPETGLPTR